MKPKLRLVGFLILLGIICIQVRAQNWEPDSVYVKGRNYEFYDSTLIASNKAIGGNIFLGQGFLNGNISNYFTNPFFIGINADIHRNNLIIQVDDYIGFGKTKETMTFPENLEWKKNKAALSFMIGCNLGYSLINTKSFKFAPIGGVGGNILSSSFMTTSENSKNEPFLPYYKLGFFIDLKSIVLLQEYTRINDKDENYTSLRLSFGINSPIGKPKYSDYYHGSMIYFTIGMGGLSRKYERK